MSKDSFADGCSFSLGGHVGSLQRVLTSGPLGRSWPWARLWASRSTCAACNIVFLQLPPVACFACWLLGVRSCLLVSRGVVSESVEPAFAVSLMDHGSPARPGAARREILSAIADFRGGHGLPHCSCLSGLADAHPMATRISMGAIMVWVAVPLLFGGC